MIQSTEVAWLAARAVVLSYFLAGCLPVLQRPTPAPLQLQVQTDDPVAWDAEAVRALAAVMPVRLIVELRVPVTTLQSGTEYERAMADVKERFVRALRSSGASLVEPIEEQPLVVVELTAAQVDSLLATGLVRKVTIDQPQKPQ